MTLQHLGKPGETDLVIHAPLGLLSYSFIGDTKARQDGKLSDVDFLTISSHRNAVQADYAVVIAESFVGEKIKRYAWDNGVLLVPLDLLTELMRLHHDTPLNFVIQQQIFEITGGLVDSIPASIGDEVSRQNRALKLLQRILMLFERAYEFDTDIQWSVERVHSNLAMEHYGDRYHQDEVSDIVDLLANPLLNAVSKSPDGLQLVMPRRTLQQTIQQIANTLND